jgi:hypothetical protein
LIQIQHKSRQIRSEGHFIGLLFPPLDEDLIDLSVSSGSEHFNENLANERRFE